MSNSLRPHESQHARPPCPSQTPGVHSDSRPSTQWCQFSHLILCRPLLLLPPIPPSIRVFSNVSTLRMRWSKYWSFSFSISPSNDYSGLISWILGLIGLISLLSKGLSWVFPSTTVWKHQFFGAQLSLWPNSHIHNDYWKNHSFDYMELCQQSDIPGIIIIPQGLKIGTF